MSSPTLTRRAALFGAAASSVALAVPVAAVSEVAKPVFVKVGSPSFSVPPNVMAAIKEWQRADAEHKAVGDAYQVSLQRGPDAMAEYQALEVEYRRLHYVAQDALSDMLRTLRASRDARS